MTDDQRPMTPAQLRAYADRLEREARAQLARAKQIRDAAETIEQLRDDSSGLTTRPQSATNDPMSASATLKQADPATRTRGRDITSDGPVAVVAKKLGMSIKALAAEIGAKYETARKWNVRGTVPDDIRAEFDRLLSTPPAKRRGKSR